jgi:hypothetical protein
MPLKIFISYRRQDSGANAIGISQYLEKEFGRKNVYINVGMQAGTKYPAIIEKHLDDRFHETSFDEANRRGTGGMLVDSLFEKS